MSKRVRYDEFRFALETKGNWSELTLCPYYWRIVRKKVVGHLGEKDVLITSLCGRGNGKKLLKFIEKHDVTIIKTYPIGESHVVRIDAPDLAKLGDSLWDLSFCDITSEITETDLNKLPHVYLDHWETGDYVNALRTRGHSFIGIVDDWSYTFLHSTDCSFLVDILRYEITRFIEYHSGRKVTIPPELCAEIATLGDPCVRLKEDGVSADDEGVAVTFILKESKLFDRFLDVRAKNPCADWSIGQSYTIQRDPNKEEISLWKRILRIPFGLRIAGMLLIISMYGLYKLIAWLFF